MKDQFKSGPMMGHRNRPNHTPLSRTLLALFFIIAGSLLIAERTGYITHEVFRMFFNWQMLLIGLGVVSISKRDNSTGGIIMILIGSVFLIPEFIDIPFDTRQLLWPAVLIGIGFIILFKGLGTWQNKFKRRFDKGNYNNMDRIDAQHIFGGGEYHITSENFQGGQINAIFGGGKYDFRNAKLAPGVNYLEVSMIFGGLDILLPADWDVKVDVVSILGEFSNKSAGYVKPSETSTGQLIIRGNAIFGGGEIKRF